MEALADAMGLGRLCLGFGVVDVLDRQIQLEVMLLHSPTELRAAVREQAQERHVVSSKNGNTRSFKRSAAVIGVFVV